MSGLMRSAGVLLMILTTTAAAQTAQENLKKARTLVGQNKFAPGLKLVDKAIAEAGNDLETTLELLELQGVCNAALKKAGPAKLAFQKLMSLSPAYNMNRRGPPAVLKIYAEAKASAEALAILPAAPDMTTGKISEIAVEVKADPHKLAKTVIFNYRVGGAKWKVRAVPAALGRVPAKVDAVDKVEWYATVLGANDAEISRIRNVDAPITHTYQAPSAPVREPPPVVADAPVRVGEPQLTPADRHSDLEVIDSGSRRAGWVAPVSVTLIVAGAAAAGIGTYFGLQSSSARRQFATATGASMDIVLGTTRQRALELDSQARNGGLIANTLWISAGALVLTGVLVALFGPTEAVR
jgi:hypothetical protein